MVAIRAALTIIVALGFGMAATAGGAAGQERSCRGVTDNILCMPLPRGWHRSLGFGVASGKPAAWLLAGNFRFPEDAAKHEGYPHVPRHRVLIWIGDFPVLGPCVHWRRVRRLHLPRGTDEKRLVKWHVRFAGRALFLGVRFGSRPDARALRLVNIRLGAVRRMS